MKRRKNDWSAVDAAILRVMRRAKVPLPSREIKKRSGVPPLHFDLRLQHLKHQGLIGCIGRTTNAEWWLWRHPL